MGIQYGLDEEMAEAALARQVDRLGETLLQALRSRKLLRDYQSGDRVARSMYICSSGGTKGLGFSVNNSGLLLCSASDRTRTRFKRDGWRTRRVEARC